MTPRIVRTLVVHGVGATRTFCLFRKPTRPMTPVRRTETTLQSRTDAQIPVELALSQARHRRHRVERSLEDPRRRLGIDSALEHADQLILRKVGPRPRRVWRDFGPKSRDRQQRWVGGCCTSGCFGEFTVTVDGRPEPVPASRPARNVLAWLAIHPGVHSRSEVAALL
jgi:hypothetical protein